MPEEYKFKDAGKKMTDTSIAATPSKVYPRIRIDLDQFPELKADVDEKVAFHGTGRVCSVTHNDWCHEMEIEVDSMAVPTHTHESIGPMNEADHVLGKLKTGKGLGRY